LSLVARHRVSAPNRSPRSPHPPLDRPLIHESQLAIKGSPHIRSVKLSASHASSVHKFESPPHQLRREPPPAVIRMRQHPPAPRHPLPVQKSGRRRHHRATRLDPKAPERLEPNQTQPIRLRLIPPRKPPQLHHVRPVASAEQPRTTHLLMRFITW